MIASTSGLPWRRRGVFAHHEGETVVLVSGKAVEADGRVPDHAVGPKYVGVRIHAILLYRSTTTNPALPIRQLSGPDEQRLQMILEQQAGAGGERRAITGFGLERDGEEAREAVDLGG